MTKEDYEQFKEKILDNIRTVLAEVPENSVMEHYTAKNLECYLRSLEILERMNRESLWQK